MNDKVKTTADTKQSSDKKEAASLYAIFESGGKQHIARLGRRLSLDKLTVKVGEQVTFDKVLMLVNGDTKEFGTPYINGTTIGANVLEYGKGPKVRIIKFKRRKHHMKRGTARQEYTEVEINSIGDVKAKAAKTANAGSVAKTAKTATTTTTASKTTKEAPAKKASAKPAESKATAKPAESKVTAKPAESKATAASKPAASKDTKADSKVKDASSKDSSVKAE